MTQPGQGKVYNSLIARYRRHAGSALLRGRGRTVNVFRGDAAGRRQRQLHFGRRRCFRLLDLLKQSLVCLSPTHGQEDFPREAISQLLGAHDIAAGGVEMCFDLTSCHHVHSVAMPSPTPLAAVHNPLIGPV